MKFVVGKSDFLYKNRNEIIKKLHYNTMDLGVLPLPLFVEVTKFDITESERYLQNIESDFCAIIPTLCYSKYIDTLKQGQIFTLSKIPIDSINKLWNKCIEEDFDYIIEEYDGKNQTG